MQHLSWFALLAAVLAMVGYAYLALEWKRGWEPARASWFTWIFVLGGTALGMIKGHAGWTAILPASYCLGTAVIWLLSLKRGIGGWKPVDCISMAIAAVGMIGWALSGNPVVAVCLGILADFAAGIPTVEKLWRDPTSESRVGWTIFIGSSLSDVLAVHTWSVTEAGYPVFAALYCIAIVLMTYRRRVQ